MRKDRKAFSRFYPSGDDPETAPLGFSKGRQSPTIQKNSFSLPSRSQDDASGPGGDSTPPDPLHTLPEYTRVGCVARNCVNDSDSLFPDGKRIAALEARERIRGPDFADQPRPGPNFEVVAPVPEIPGLIAPGTVAVNADSGEANQHQHHQAWFGHCLFHDEFLVTPLGVSQDGPSGWVVASGDRA